ncbi:MAG: DUF6797 domain-containing protein [Gemmataceae bacterium]
MRIALTLLLALPAIAIAQPKKPPPDHGAVLATAMEVAPVALKDTTDLALTTNYVFRGRAITLDKERTVHLCFDTDHMRVAGAWVGKYPAYSAFKNMGPVLEGSIVFSTRPGPGWAKRRDWKDPRPCPEGPLPKDWAHYKGLYVHGDRVVLSYSVGKAHVLELPGAIVKDGWHVITRTLAIDSLDEAQTLLVCEETKDKTAAKIDGNLVHLTGPAGTLLVAVTNPPKPFAWEFLHGRLTLRIGASPKPTRFRLAYARPPEGGAVRSLERLLTTEVEDPVAFTKGGPARWTKEFTTDIIPGESKTEPYVVDQILLPEGNPYSPLIRPAGLDFFKDGRCAVCTWDGDVWIVSGLDTRKATWKRFATGLQQPLGLKIIDGVIYTAGRDQITRLHDLNADGAADFYENFNNDAPLTLQRHEFVMDLQTDADGYLYYCRSGHYITSPSGANCVVYKLTSDGSKLEAIARGFREPNGMAIGPDGTMTVGDNEGNGIPQTPIYRLLPGKDYGYKPQSKPGGMGGTWTYTEKPIVWLDKTVDRSAGGQVWVTSDKWGPLQGQLLHLSYGNCRLFNLLIDKAGEPWQGAVWQFPVTFYSGIMRARFSPADGQLYLCGLRGWDNNSTKDGQLARVRYTGHDLPIPRGIRVTKRGVELTFTQALKKSSAENDENWGGEWSEPIVKGGPLKGKEEMPIAKARLSADGKTVSVDLERVIAVSNYTLQYRLESRDGIRVSGAVHGTIHTGR